MRARAIVSIGAALAVALLAASPAGGVGGDRPFRVGEKLTFRIQYGFIRAGTAELRVRPGGPDGSLLLTSRAWSNSFFDVFFRVRDEVRAWIDPETIESIRFEKRLREGKFSADEFVAYDRARGVAVYDDSTKVALLPGARDVLTAFYWLRSRRLPIRGKVPLTYHASRKNWPIHVSIDTVEEVKVPAGIFRCIRIEPFLRSVGVFKQTGRLRIWVTADERRMPVKLESKVAFGSFKAVLTDYQTP